jgi:hypothetical protein
VHSSVELTALRLFSHVGDMAIYLDPGTGSLVIQFTVGAITGLLVAARLFGRNLVTLFRKKSKVLRPPEQDAPRRNIQDAAAPGEGLDETRK